jgi:hypothetical protein
VPRHSWAAGGAWRLAASGTRAMYVMLGRLRACGVSQFDLRARMFDALVEPVLSYAAHVWGPTVLRACLRAGQPPTLASAPDKLHLHFLRLTAGWGMSALRCCCVTCTGGLSFPLGGAAGAVVEQVGGCGLLRALLGAVCMAR